MSDLMATTDVTESTESPEATDRPAARTQPAEPELATADLLVEEVSIDGMCGVY
jgi:mycofactocin precursor